MGKGIAVETFSAQEIAWGLQYAKKENGIDLNPVLLNVLVCTVRRVMNRTRRPMDDVRTEVMDRAYRVEFHRRAGEGNTIRKEMEAMSQAIGKILNNRKNFLSPGFSPTERKGSKRERKTRTVTESNGQMSFIPGK